MNAVLHGLAGYAAFMVLAWLMSEKRGGIPWRTVADGVVLQWVLASTFLKLPGAQALFAGLNDLMLALEAATRTGTSMVFGFLGGAPRQFAARLDVMTRMLANGLAATLKQPVIVENRAGDAARIATEYVKNAAPDGNTLLMTPFGPTVINPHLYARLRYDPVAG